MAGPEAGAPRVLLVGNSYFYYNNFIQSLKGLKCTAGADELRPVKGHHHLGMARYAFHAQGGAGLWQHQEYFRSMLLAFDPDIVLVQDYSLGPCDDQRRQQGLAVVRDVFSPAVKEWLGSSSGDGGGGRRRSLYFVTCWARAERMFEEPDKYLEGKAYADESSLMEALERGMVQYVAALRNFVGAMDNFVVGIVPFGRITWELRRRWKESERSYLDAPYVFDARAHPSPLGTFIQALSVWKTIFGGGGVKVGISPLSDPHRGTYPEIVSFYQATMGDEPFKDAVEFINGEKADAIFAHAQRAVMSSSSFDTLTAKVATDRRDPRLRVMIVGNSYSYYNGLIHMLKGLLGAEGANGSSERRENDKDLQTARYLLLVEGGVGLREHSKDFGPLLLAFDPDVVLLQDFSLGPCDPQGRQRGLAAVREQIAPAVRAWMDASLRDPAERKRSVYFLATWARSQKMFEEPDRYLDGKRYADEAALMQSLEDGVLQYAAELRASLASVSGARGPLHGLSVGVVPVGRAFLGLRQRWTAAGRPYQDALHIYDSRGHPSPLGTFVQAATIWKLLHGGAGAKASLTHKDSPERATFPEIVSFFYGAWGREPFDDTLEWINSEAADTFFAKLEGSSPTGSASKRHKS